MNKMKKYYNDNHPSHSKNILKKFPFLQALEIKTHKLISKYHKLFIEVIMNKTKKDIIGQNLMKKKNYNLYNTKNE